MRVPKCSKCNGEMLLKSRNRLVSHYQCVLCDSQRSHSSVTNEVIQSVYVPVPEEEDLEEVKVPKKRKKLLFQ